MLRLLKGRAFKNRFLSELPSEYKDAAKLVFFPLPSPLERALANDIESFRPTISMLVDKLELYSFSSPHSGTFSSDDKGHAKAGPLKKSSVKSHMRTGSGRLNGLLLRRIVEGSKAKRILELGTNTGFSGCYFLSLPQVEELITIEGSEDLCGIAEKNLERISKKFRIMNILFDEAIDQLVAESASFDCIFIDGQHEQGALLHYTERVMPLLTDNGLIIYDDIYWSNDMNAGWRKLASDNRFSEAVDLCVKGVVRVGDKMAAPRQYDLCAYVGRPSLYRKNW